MIENKNEKGGATVIGLTPQVLGVKGHHHRRFFYACFYMSPISFFILPERTSLACDVNECRSNYVRLKQFHTKETSIISKEIEKK